MKKIIGLIALIGLLITAWLGASFYSARTTGNYVTSLPELYKQNESMHIKTIEHQQSAFSSTGKFEIRFPNYVPVADGTSTALGIVIQYKISNLLLLDSAGRFEWKMTGNEMSEPTLKKLFGQGPTMLGKGHISYGGQRHSSVELSELLFKDTQNSFKLSPLTGLATWDNQSLKLKLKSEHLNARSKSVATDWHGMSLDINVSDRNLGLGTYTFSIDKGATDSSAFESMKITKTVSSSDNRFNLAIAQTFKQYSYEKFKLSDVDLELALRGMDKDSLMTISTIFRDSKDFNKLTTDERLQLSKALRELFNKGFSVGIPRLETKIDGGSLIGNLNLEVIKSDGVPDTVFSSSQRLRAEGQVTLNGKGGLDNTQRTTALMLGLAVKTPEGLKTSFQFSNGVIKANNKTFDLKENLNYIDSLINAALTP